MTVTVFMQHRLLAQGAPEQVIPAIRALGPLDRASDLLVFDDDTGRQVDLDLREQPEEPKGRGRPALGVKAREVTLLPRHWDWLNSQRGGASAAIRRLVDEARAVRTPEQARDAAFRFLTAMAGDLPAFEEACRELYAGNRTGFVHCAANWPEAVRDHALRLGWPE